MRNWTVSIRKVSGGYEKTTSSSSNEDGFALSGAFGGSYTQMNREAKLLLSKWYHSVWGKKLPDEDTIEHITDGAVRSAKSRENPSKDISGRMYKEWIYLYQVINGIKKNVRIKL